MTSPDDTEQPGKPLNRFWTEYSPAIAFVAVYNILLRRPEATGYFSKDNALYTATGVLIAITLLIIAVLLIRRERIPPMLLFASAIIGGFGTLGIVFQNKIFLFIKPTIINVGFSAMIFGGLAMGRNFIRMLMGSAIAMPEKAWLILAIRWGFFFLAMAIWNEVLWRNFSETTWANWKLGNLGIVLIFIFANTPFIMKHMIEDATDENETA